MCLDSESLMTRYLLRRSTQRLNTRLLNISHVFCIIMLLRLVSYKLPVIEE